MVLFVVLLLSTRKEELEMGVFMLPLNCASCANTAEHAIANRNKD